MANLQVSLDIKNPRALQRDILEALAAHLRAALQKSLGGIRGRIGEVLAEAIHQSPEYTSLLNGKLRGELGVVDAAPVLNVVLQNIVSGVKATSLGARRAGAAIEGGLRIEILKGDYSEVLAAAGASFQSEGGYEIDWLRWLTLEGDRILVADHRFVAGFSQRSRTGLGIMQSPGAWRVPPEFAGTANDNWLTRAIGAIGPDIEKIIADELQRSL